MHDSRSLGLHARLEIFATLEKKPGLGRSLHACMASVAQDESRAHSAREMDGDRGQCEGKNPQPKLGSVPPPSSFAAPHARSAATMMTYLAKKRAHLAHGLQQLKRSQHRQQQSSSVHMIRDVARSDERVLAEAALLSKLTNLNAELYCNSDHHAAGTHEMKVEKQNFDPYFEQHLEEAARRLGSACPRSASAKAAALAILTYNDNREAHLDELRHHPLSAEDISIGNSSRSLALPPGRILLQSYSAARAQRGSRLYMLSSTRLSEKNEMRPTLCDEHAARHVCMTRLSAEDDDHHLTFVVGGLRLFAASDGILKIGRPPEVEDSFFTMMPLLPPEERAIKGWTAADASVVIGAESGSECHDRPEILVRLLHLRSNLLVCVNADGLLHLRDLKAGDTSEFGGIDIDFLFSATSLRSHVTSDMTDTIVIKASTTRSLAAGNVAGALQSNHSRTISSTQGCISYGASRPSKSRELLERKGKDNRTNSTSLQCTHTNVPVISMESRQTTENTTVAETEYIGDAKMRSELFSLHSLIDEGVSYHIGASVKAENVQGLLSDAADLPLESTEPGTPKFESHLGPDMARKLDEVKAELRLQWGL